MSVSPLTCTSEELFTIITSPRPQFLRLCLANPAMTAQHVVLLLRNRAVTSEIIESICETQDWISQHNVQFAVVNCSKTSHTLALRILQLLYWNDLVKTAANLRLSPRLRRAAENHLRNKLTELSGGEKITLARTGPRSIISFLRMETEPRIITALLQNPHLVEEDVLLIVNDELADPDVLAAVGKEYKWSTSYPVRVALVRNSRTPLPLALSLVSKLRKQELELLQKTPETAELIRRAASRILDGNY